MTVDEQEAVEQSVAAGDFTVPGLTWEWLSPLCCVAWDEQTCTLTIGDALDCQVLSYSVAARLADFLERHLPDPSEVIER